MVLHKIKHVAKTHMARTDVAIVAATAIILLTAFYSLWQVNEAFTSLGSVTSNMTGIIELPQAAQINLTLISVPNCSECYYYDDIISSLNSSDVNLSLEVVQLDSDAARGLINDYGIEKLPALYVMGETNKTAALAALFGAEAHTSIMGSSRSFSASTSSEDGALSPPAPLPAFLM